MTDNDVFRKEFRKWVKKHGLSWSWISRQTNVPYDLMWRWQDGQRKLRDEYLEALWIFTNKSLTQPTYQHPRPTKKVYPIFGK